jgi:cytochrome d ubiquinol oxidase subunit I
VAGLHAHRLLRDPGSSFHRKALAITFPVAAVAALLQPLSGDLSARMVAKHQPVKLAAMEAQWETRRRAPLRIGGMPDERAEVTRHALEIPAGLSLLAHHDPDAEVRGLQEEPRADRPPVTVVHVAFQIMVACGGALAVVAMLGSVLAWRRRGLPDRPGFLRLLVATSPLGILAVEAGWTVTEVGRQPWIIGGVMRTAEGVTPMPVLVIPFVTFTVLYLVLGAVVVALLCRLVMESPRDSDRDGAASGCP